jgi:branched-chain amino acid transport system permease protein
LNSRFKNLAPFAGFALVALGVQLGLSGTGQAYCLTQLTMALYYAIVILGLALVMGYAGQVSLGHGAFFALGGYTTAVLTTLDLSRWASTPWATVLGRLRILASQAGLYGGQTLTVSPWAAAMAAVVIAAVVGTMIGYPALRLKGQYLAMATLGFGLIVYKFVLGTSFTGAADGIQGVPEWRLVGGLALSGKSAARVSNYYVACALVLGVLVLLRNLVHSRVGRALQAIHDREAAANAMGIDTAAYKLRAFVVSAVLAAVAGVCFTHYTGGIGPSEAGALKSVRYVALAAAGGMANLWGVTVISVALNYASLRGWFGSYDHAVFGGLLVLIITLAPAGPLQPLGRWLRRRFAAGPGERRSEDGAA